MNAERLLALIPAKGSSTRLPRKNALVLDGEPLVTRTIRCARESGVFADIVVSTEDPEIAELARTAGAAVPFIRPRELSVDPAGVVDVTLHALDEMQARGQSYDVVIILLPTSPFRTADDIREALRIFNAQDCDNLMSVSPYEHQPLAALTLSNGLLTPLLPDWLNRTGAGADAKTPVVVRANGAITICRIERLRRERNYYAYPLAAYEMPIERGVDIDTIDDLRLAEYLSQQEKPGRSA